MIKGIIEHIKAVLFSFFKRKSSITKQPRKKTKTPVDESGVFYFKRGILDELDRYFRYIKAMKRADEEAYKIFSKVGAGIVSGDGLADSMDFEPSVKKIGIPTFGCAALLGGDTKDVVGIKFAYFRKLDRAPIGVEQTNGTVLSLKLFYVTEKGKRTIGSDLECYVAVSSDLKTIRPLKMVKQSRRVVRCKNIAQRRRLGGKEIPNGSASSFVVPEIRVGLSDHLFEIADGSGWGTPSELVRRLTRLLVNFSIVADKGIRVTCKRQNVAAVFNIDMLRTPYFFSDRNPVFADEGHKKRIFHIVRTHKRTLKDKSVQYVKSHFRGLREFEWNGYDITITVPEYHHAMLSELNIASHQVDEDEPIKGYMDSEAIGDRLAQVISSSARETAWKSQRKNVH